MKYKILTGKYETGTEEQKAPFKNMFGKDVLYKFDLYFQWYNIIHELGHCLLDVLDINMENVDEEFWVNRFAIAYWKKANGSNRLAELKGMLDQTLLAMQNPVPQGQNYLDFFKSIWQSMPEMSEEQRTLIYGYFQFSCVTEAMKREDDLVDLLQDMGVKVNQDIAFEQYQGDIQAESVRNVLDTCIKNLQSMGIRDLNVGIELVDNPAIHCANME